MSGALWKCQGGENGGKPNYGIPTFPPPRSHFSKPVCEWGCRSSRSVFCSERSYTTNERSNLACGPPFTTHPVSGSSRVGIDCPFQAHPALEIYFDFRLTSGLENAHASIFSPAVREP